MQYHLCRYRCSCYNTLNRTRGKWGVSRCEQADYTVNFLSVAYVQSSACVEEWCFSKEQCATETILNLVIGGRAVRNAIKQSVHLCPQLSVCRVICIEGMR